jgi:ABC-2 type transport system permease protein
MTHWRPIARRELVGLLNGRLRKAGFGLVAFVLTAGGYVAGSPGTESSMAEYARTLADITPFLVTGLGLLVGYRAIVADRAAGRLALVLTLPHSRLDVLAGKTIARGSVLVAVLTVGVLTGAWLVEYPYGAVAVGPLVAYLTAVLLLGAATFGLGLTVSTLTTSPRRATVGAFAVLVAAAFWGALRAPLFVALQRVGLLTPDGSLPDWALFAHGLEPTTVFARVVDAFVIGRDTGAYLGPDAPWYLGGETAVALLVGWAIVPAFVGYRRFRGTDL